MKRMSKQKGRKWFPLVMMWVMAIFPLFSQERIVESVKVEISTLPVFAVDDRGQPVRDLKAEDIELFVNNKKITAFSFLRKTFLTAGEEKETAPAGAGDRQDREEENKTITLLFDTAASKAASVMRMKSIAEDIIAKSGKNCLFIIMSIRPYKGLQHIGGPLTDRDKILDIIEKKVVPTYNFRNPGEQEEFVYGRGGYQALGAGKGGEGPGKSIEALYAGMLAERSRNYIKHRSAALARSFEELYYSLNTIKGRKFLYFFSEGFANSIGSDFSGLMAKYFLRTGAMTFIIDPAGGKGNSAESGESFLRALAESSGSKYIRGSTKNISHSIKNIHRAYYELAFEVPEELSGKNVYVTLKPLRENITVHTTRFIENKYIAALNDTGDKEIKIDKVSFVNHRLNFEISGYLRKELEGKELGLLKVTILVPGKDGEPVFSDAKFLKVDKDVMRASIPFNRLTGNYNVLIIADDLLTKRKAQVSRPVEF